ncbi:MAG: SCO family protein [Thiohalorhabdus sp.]|uniref:SCO family protein n=1 Tax=Thiohalorhabdus sp. TaxID=3094134 RepID=UPI00397F85DE
MQTQSPTGTTPAPEGRNRAQLWLLLLVFVGPVIAAGVLYANADHWFNGNATGHHGQLVDPARPLQGLPVLDAEGNRLGLEAVRGKWTLVYIGSGQCGADCRSDLYGMRQAHKAQGKNIGRVQRLFIARDGILPEGAFLAEEHPNLKVGRLAPGASLEAFDAGDREKPPAGIYMVDPNANLVLRYEPGAPPKGILKDLESLLKHSTIG